MRISVLALRMAQNGRIVETVVFDPELQFKSCHDDDDIRAACLFELWTKNHYQPFMIAVHARALWDEPTVRQRHAVVVVSMDRANVWINDPSWSVYTSKGITVVNRQISYRNFVHMIDWNIDPDTTSAFTSPYRDHGDANILFVK